MIFRRKKKDKNDYALTYDNLAIPEIHTHPTDESASEPDENDTVTFDSVAIPEVHIRKKPHKK